MNDSSDKKTAAIKTLAIVGFFATLVILVWALVQGLRFVPSTFSSLASIAESIQNYRPGASELTLGIEKNIVNSGESFKVTWTDMKQKGTYRFSYTCTEGVSVEVRGADNNLVTVPCTGNISLSQDILGLFISINSAKNRFVDVPFTVAFERVSGGDARESKATVTVVNATIPLTASSTTPATSSTTLHGVSSSTPVVTTKEPEEKKTETPKQVPEIPKPVTTETPAPARYIDLKTTFLGIGTMDGNTFVPSGTYDPALRGGVKFDIGNAGTKTSNDWTFTALLPSGETYHSDIQPALHPGDHVVFTLGFEVTPDTKTKSVKISIQAYDPVDANHANDGFTWSVGLK